MTMKTREVLSFDYGIETITKAEVRPKKKLPDAASPVMPSSEHPNEQLQKILSAQPLGHRILASLEPMLTDKDFLIPARYQAMFEDVRTVMAKMLGGKRSATDKRKIRKALKLMEEERELMDLLRYYRSLLHKG